MATRKFKCKVCGYVHTGDSAPEKCPVCQVSGSEFEEIVEPSQAAPKVLIPTAMSTPLCTHLLW